MISLSTNSDKVQDDKTDKFTYINVQIFIAKVLE